MRSITILLYCFANLTISKPIDHQFYPQLIARTSPKSPEPSSSKEPPRASSSRTSYLPKSGNPRPSSPKRPLPISDDFFANFRDKDPNDAFHGMRNGPFERKQALAHQRAPGPGSRSPSPPRRIGYGSPPQRSRSPSPPSISGHPTSAMVVAHGPALVETQQMMGKYKQYRVKKGDIKFANVEDPYGAWASAIPGPGGRATAASTGNAATGYVGVAEGVTGFVQTHDGDKSTEEEVKSGKQIQKHSPGDNTGRVKSAALSTIDGHGQVSAVGLHKGIHDMV